MDAATRNRIEAAGRSLNRRVLAPLSAWQTMLHALTETRPEPGEPSRPDPVPAAGARRRRARDRCRPAPPLARSDHPVRRHARRAGAGPAGHLGHACATRAMPIRKPPGSRPRHASARRICPRRRSAPRSPARSTTPPRPAPSSSPTCTAATSHSSPPPIAHCSSPRAAARSACSPRSAGCRRCMRASRRNWRRPAFRSTPSTSMRWATPRWSTSSAPRRRAACSAPTRCATASMCRGARCAWWCSRRCPGHVPTFCIGNGASISRTAIRRRYDDRIARLRLRQAFGRLIRRATDRGVFVLLDRQTPSRLLSAFPAGVAIRRVGLAEAVRQTRAFLGESLPA